MNTRWLKPGQYLVLSLMLVAGLSACKEDGTQTTAKSEPAACTTCGVIVSIEPVRQKGEASGAGAVMGAVIGGVVGHQIGGGRGKDVATVAGAAGGAMAGHEIEKRSKATTSYDITVRLDSGGTRVVNMPEPAGFAVGDKVRVSGGSLARQS